MKCDNFVSPFKHDLCAPGCCHDKLLALLLMASAWKVNNERLRCAEVFSQAEYSTTSLSIDDVGTRKDLYVSVVLYGTEMVRSGAKCLHCPDVCSSRGSKSTSFLFRAS